MNIQWILLSVRENYYLGQTKGGRKSRVLEGSGECELRLPQKVLSYYQLL